MAAPLQQSSRRALHDESVATCVAAAVGGAIGLTIRTSTAARTPAMMRVASRVELGGALERPRTTFDAFLVRVVRVARRIAPMNHVKKLRSHVVGLALQGPRVRSRRQSRLRCTADCLRRERCARGAIRASGILSRELCTVGARRSQSSRRRSFPGVWRARLRIRRPVGQQLVVLEEGRTASQTNTDCT